MSLTRFSSHVLNPFHYRQIPCGGLKPEVSWKTSLCTTSAMRNLQKNKGLLTKDARPAILRRFHMHLDYACITGPGWRK